MHAISRAQYRSCPGLVTICCLWVCLGCQSAALTSAKIYMQENETGKARQKLEEALRAEPQNPEIHFLLGKIAASTGNYQAMASAFQRALGLSAKFAPEIQELRLHYWADEYNHGVEFATSEPLDLQAASRSFRHAVIIDPERLEAWRNLAFTYYQLDSLDAAIETYEGIVAATPGDTSALSSLGALYLNQQRYEEAVRALSHLVEADPDHADAYINIGVAYEQLERLNDAEEAYRQAILLDPGSALGHYNLGNIYWNREAYQEAIEAYEKAVELDPEDDNSLYNLAVSYLSVEDLDRALPLLQELSERMAGSASVWRKLGRIYAIKGRIEESKEAYGIADSLSR